MSMAVISVTGPRTVLGFDFGRSRIGIAVGQEITLAAHPLATLTVHKQKSVWVAIGQFVSEWKPDLLVVGVPRHADGSPNSTTLAALRFSRQLNGRYRLPVETIDERLSSLEAEAQIASKPRPRNRHDKDSVDSTAAALILESWFTQQRTETRAKN
jgi:putative Holliday junction resolvase